MKKFKRQNISILGIVMLVLAGLFMVWGGAASAAEQPQRGGILTFGVGSESATFDAHNSSTYGNLHPIAPLYSLLLKFDQDNYPNIIGDLAESWTVSPDNKTYTFKIRKGVTFHNGTKLSARDIKASYDKLIWPLPGVGSRWKLTFSAVEKIEVPEEYTVVFTLKWPAASFLSSLAAPWNYIYSADILAKNPTFYAKNIMGSGPFKLKEAVTGSHFSGVRNEGYFRKGLPYLDGYRAVFVKSTGARIGAIRGGRLMAEFRGFAPSQIDEVSKAMGDKVQIMKSPLTVAMLVGFNVNQKPFDDVRVRRALSLAVNQWEAAEVLSKITVLKFVGGFIRPGSKFAMTDEELTQMPAFSRDIEANRKEAIRLLREAGIPEGFSFVLYNRGPPMPYEATAVWLIDQWRKIGLNVTQQPMELGPFYADLKAGKHSVYLSSFSAYMDDPDIIVENCLTRSTRNFSHHKDKVVDDLYAKQSVTVDDAERRKLTNELQRRVIDEMAYFVPFLWWQRVVPIRSNVKGVKLLSNHFINQDLSTIWLSKD